MVYTYIKKEKVALCVVSVDVDGESP